MLWLLTAVPNSKVEVLWSHPSYFVMDMDLTELQANDILHAQMRNCVSTSTVQQELGVRQ